MNLQTVFYAVAIIYMILFIIMLAGILVLLWYIKQKIHAVHQTLDRSLADITDKATKPFDMAADIGSSFMDAISQTIHKIRNKTLTTNT